MEIPFEITYSYRYGSKSEILSKKEVKKILKKLDSKSILKLRKLIDTPSDLVFLNVDKMNKILKMRKKRPPKEITVTKEYHGKTYKRSQLV